MTHANLRKFINTGYIIFEHIFNKRIPSVAWVTKSKVESLVTLIRKLVGADNSEQQFHRLAQHLKEHFTLNQSDKHMAHRALGRLEPTLPFKYKGIA